MKVNFVFLWVLFAIASLARADFDDKPTGPAPTLAKPPASNKSKNSTREPQAPTMRTPTQTAPEHSSSSSSTDPMFEHDTAAPVNYSADSLSGSRKDGMLELIKNVVITQAQTTMWSDKAEIYSVPGTQKPKRMVSRGHVRLYKKPNAQGVEMRATADEIEYFADTQKAILRGRPVIYKGKEVLRGEQIEVDLVTEAIKVKNPSGVVDPKAQGTAKPKTQNNQQPKTGK